MRRFVSNTHARLVMTRRVKTLGRLLSRLFPASGTVLDVGCGDGSIAATVHVHRPDLQFKGVDVFLRPETAIPAQVYDGVLLPFPDNSFDFAMINDVLHHTDDPAAVLAECLRVARYGVVIKDHVVKGFAARPTLQFMDWIGNWSHGVRLPYNYLTETQWKMVFETCHCSRQETEESLNLYPVPFTWLFDRSLHFISRVQKHTVNDLD